jgi:hypothetical protein
MAGLEIVGVVRVLFVKVSDPANVESVPVVGKVTPVVPLQVRVIPNAPEVIKLPPSAIVRVALVVGAVIATLLIDVAVATPKTGVTKVGLVAKTLTPVPVSSVNNALRLVLDGVAKNVAAPVPRPETPVEIGRLVQLVRVPLDGVPNTGVVKVGLVRVLLVSVSEPAKVDKVPVVGSVTPVVAVAVKVTAYAPAVIREAPSAIVSVEPVAGAVKVTLLIEVAVATPKVGVTKVGLVRVLLVSVSEPASVDNVPVVGKVTPVVAVAVSVTA